VSVGLGLGEAAAAVLGGASWPRVAVGGGVRLAVGVASGETGV